MDFSVVSSFLAIKIKAPMNIQVQVLEWNVGYMHNF